MGTKTPTTSTKRSEAARKAAATRKLNAEADRKVAEAKLEADRKAAEARIAAADRKVVEARKAEARKAEAKLEADRKVEKAQLKAEAKLEADRKAAKAQRKAEAKLKADRKAAKAQRKAEARTVEAHEAAEEPAERYVEDEPRNRTWVPWLIVGVLMLLLIVVVFWPRATVKPAALVQPTAVPYIYVQPTAVPYVYVQPTAAPIVYAAVPPTAAPIVQQAAPVVPVSNDSPAVQQAANPAGSMPAFVTDVSHSAWNIQGTDRLADNPIIAGWLSRLQDPAPSLWKVFPNVPNPDVPAFRVVNGNQVPDGMEYGTYSSPYCWSSPCDIPVGAWEYRYISGDYKFLDMECKGDMQKGCMLILINEMDQSYTWRGQYVDNGFTLRGRYFNGDALEWGVWGLVSHGAANMLNMKTFAHPGEVLNAGDPGNSGANCGTPSGCKSVDVTIVVHAGDAVVAVAKTTVTK